MPGIGDHSMSLLVSLPGECKETSSCLTEGRFQLDIRKTFFMLSVVKHWNRYQRGGRCPMPGNIQGQVEQGSEQPDLGEDVTAHCRGGWTT